MERIPCEHQNNAHNAIPDSNHPCLICSGTMPSKKYTLGVCPFTLHKNNAKFCQLRTDVSSSNITATERFFLIQQQNKVNKSLESE